MGNFAPALVLPDSPAPRQPLPFGLFSVLSWADTGDVHWQNGVTWEAVGCQPVSGIGDPTCAPGSTAASGLPKNFVTGSALGNAGKFTVYGEYKCSPFGHSDDIAFSLERATSHLFAREEARVEQAFWSGDLGNTPSLQGASDLTPGSGAVAPIVALATLEKWLGSVYGSLGVIHVGRGAVNYLAQNGAIVAVGKRLYTRLGTPVVAGSGYVNTSPTGSTPASGEHWAYATPAVFGMRSEVFTSTARRGDLLDRSKNDLYAVAERTYIVGFDPCGSAAVRFTGTCC